MKFLTVFLASLAIMAALFAGIGRLVDPRGDFRTGVFPLITMDARAEKTRLFRKYQAAAPVEGLILGSSRSMKMKPQEFEAGTGKRVFNFSVNSGRTEDMLAAYRWVRAQGAHPRLLIIGLDVEALHDSERFSAQLEEHRELRAMLDEPAPKTSRLSRLKKSVTRYKRVFTSDYTRDMGTSLAKRVAPDWGEFTRFEGDGYISYRVKERALQDGTYNLAPEINKSISEYQERFVAMKTLSPKRKAYLETLLDEAQSDGAQVVVWLTCLHPHMVAALRETTRYGPLLEETRRYLQDLQRRRHIVACDYSEPQLFNGSTSDWYDGAHLATRNARLVSAGLLARLKSAPPVSQGANAQGANANRAKANAKP